MQRLARSACTIAGLSAQLLGSMAFAAPVSVEFQADMYGWNSENVLALQGQLEANATFDLEGPPLTRYDLDNGAGKRGVSSLSLMNLELTFNGLSYWMQYGSIVFSSDSPGIWNPSPGNYVDSVVFNAEMHPDGHGGFPNSFHVSFAFTGPGSMLTSVDPPDNLNFFDAATSEVARMNLVTWPARVYSSIGGIRVSSLNTVPEPSSVLLFGTAFGVFTWSKRRGHISPPQRS